eukprot:1137823-Pelagomonas_calceolata.AAC.1
MIALNKEFSSRSKAIFMLLYTNTAARLHNTRTIQQAKQPSYLAAASWGVNWTSQALFNMLKQYTQAVLTGAIKDLEEFGQY